MKVKFYCFLFSVMLGMAINVSAEETETTTVEEEKEIGTVEETVVLDGNTFLGTYSGPVNTDGKPDGEGKFVPDTSSDTFELEGIWEAGVLEGEATISYTDGSCFTGTFQEGILEGGCKLVYSDGRYDKYRYRNGAKNGFYYSYSADDELIEYDYYYNSVSVFDEVNNAADISAADLLESPRSYDGVFIKTEGTIKKIYEYPKEQYIVVEDEYGQDYVYRNYNASINVPQSLAPNMKEGENVILYGYFYDVVSYPETDEEISYTETEENIQTGILASDLTTLDSTEIWNSIKDKDASILDEWTERSSVPSLDLVYGEIIGTGNTIKNLILTNKTGNCSYTDFCEYVYYFTYKKVTFTGTIINTYVNYDSGYIYCLIQGEKPTELYYGVYGLENGLTEGKKIKFTANFAGNKKIQCKQGEDTCYIICPRVKITKMKAVE